MKINSFFRLWLETRERRKILEKEEKRVEIKRERERLEGDERKD